MEIAYRLDCWGCHGNHSEQALDRYGSVLGTVAEPFLLVLDHSVSVESRPGTALHVVVKNVHVEFEVSGANGSRVVWITDVQTDSIKYTQSGNI